MVCTKKMRKKKRSLPVGVPYPLWLSRYVVISPGRTCGHGRTGVGGDSGGVRKPAAERHREWAQRVWRDTFRKYTCCQSMPLKKMCSFNSRALGKRRESES